MAMPVRFSTLVMHYFILFFLRFVAFLFLLLTLSTVGISLTDDADKTDTYRKTLTEEVTADRYGWPWKPGAGAGVFR